MTPLVTIGIPCFNNAQWIKAAVESALAQNWPAKEIIVVDDGSTDGSKEILCDFGDAICVVFSEHKGSNPARNEILRRAQGEWVQYLDADDYLLPEKISRQLAEAGNEKCEVIYSPVLVNNVTTGAPLEADPIDPAYDIYMQWFSWQMPQTGGCLWRRATLNRLHGWNETMPCCQEHELYMRALKEGVRFSFAPTANAVYRIWSEQTLCRRDPRQVMRVRTGLMDDLRDWMRKRVLWNKRHRAVAAQAYFEMSRTLAKQDLAAAALYHAERKRLSLINPRGPAAPLSYRLAYTILGFSGAERLARALR